MPRKAYPTDLKDKEWAVIEPYVPKPKTGGRPAEHSRREIINAIAYVLRSGCAWRLMLHDLPPWSTVYDYFRQWRIDGTWEHINTALREKLRTTIGVKPNRVPPLSTVRPSRRRKKGASRLRRRQENQGTQATYRS